MGGAASRAAGQSSRNQTFQTARTSLSDVPEQAARHGVTQDVVKQANAVHDSSYVAAIRDASSKTGVQGFTGEWVDRPVEDLADDDAFHVPGSSSSGGGGGGAAASSQRPLPRYRGPIVRPTYDVPGCATMAQIKELLEEHAAADNSDTGSRAEALADKYGLAVRDVHLLLKHNRSPQLIRHESGRLIGQWHMPQQPKTLPAPS